MKITFESKRGIKLVGILENEKAKKCVILAHGFLDDKDNERWVALKENLKDFAVFRFDFGGHGESEQGIISIKNQLKDLRTAIEFMKKKYSRVGILGHSLGGIVSLRAGNKADAVIGWAAATKPGTSSSLDRLNKKIRDNDFIIEKHGKKYSIDNSYPDERLSIDPEELVGRINKPLLLLHGSADSIISVDQTFNAEKYIKNGKITILQGEDHNFKDRLYEAITISIDWMKRYL